jgi:hypothetical protein
MEQYCIVVFKLSKTFWDKFFLGDYCHVSLIKNDGINWIFYDPRPEKLESEIFPFNPDEDIKTVLNYFRCDLNAVRVKVTEPLSDRKILIPRFFNCVKLVKYLLGIKPTGFFPTFFFNKLKNGRIKSLKSEFLYEHRR